MPVAEIIAIGTELLLGEIQDTNTRYLARALRDEGVDLYRTIVVGDNIERIAQAIHESMERAQIILTTGGLGPTVDDPTREAVALAAGVPVIFMPELWDQIQNRFQRFGRPATENNRRQAYIPLGAIPIENPVGTAPAFIVETPNCAIASLPGVPREMEYLYTNRILPYLRKRFDLHGLIKARVLHATGIGESQVDALIGDLEITSNPTVGLLAHAGQVDIRITAKAETVEEADRLINSVEELIRQRLADAIYGADGETLESVIYSALQANGLHLGMVECGLQGEIARRLTGAVQMQVIPDICPIDELNKEMRRLNQASGVEVVLGASLQTGPEKQVLNLSLMLPGGIQETTRSYGGPPSMGSFWAVNTALDFLRRNLAAA